MEANRKKVFISSTLRDLREYRSAVRSLLEQSLGLEVLENDKLDANPDEPLIAMYKMIDQCDIFIGIYARYYGRIPQGQEVSYIESEYEYAKSKSKPQFCFILERNQQWPSEWIESDPRLTKQLYRFLDKIMKDRIVAFFTAPDDLANKAQVSIEKYISTTINLREPTKKALPTRLHGKSVPSFKGISKTDPRTGQTYTKSKIEVTASDKIKKTPILKKRTKKSDVATFADPASIQSFTEIIKNPKTDSDRPSGPDRLNYSKYAEAFTKITLNHETSTPLTIGIYGQWGQGKSFLMAKIKEALKGPVKKKTPITLFTFRTKYNLDAILESINLILRKITTNNIDRLTNVISKSMLKGFKVISLGFTNPLVVIRALNQRGKIRSKIKREKVDFHLIEFNAWAYVGTDHLWAGLVTQLYKEAEKYFGLQLHIARLWRAINKSLPKSLRIFAFYALLGVGVSLLLNFNEVQTSWDTLKIAINAIAGSLIGGSAIASLPTLLTTLKEFSDNLVLTRSKDLQNLAARPDFRAQIGVMADIKEEIRFIGKLLRKGKQGHPTRFILFIDDLDRCEHTKAVEVMQAIMLLLTDEDGAPFVIFMGIDARVIVHAIEANYEEVLVKAGINGYEYLDKIVQIPFVIPSAPLEDIKRYVDSMLWSEEEKTLFLEKKALAQPAVVAAPSAPPAVDELPKQTEVVPSPTPLDEMSVSFTELERTAINDCAKDLVDNPRKIKRIINIYRYARLILPAEQDRSKAIRWYLMVEQWPLHVAWIIEYIENDQQQTKSKLKGKTIFDVYKLVKKNIRSEEMESLLAIDADPDNFVSFIKEYGFTVQEIIALLPITFNLNPAIRSEVGKQMLKASAPKPRRKKPETKKKPANIAQSA